MKEEQRLLLRQLPAIHDLLKHDHISELQAKYELDISFITLICQESVELIRHQILEQLLSLEGTLEEHLLQMIGKKMFELVSSPLKPLINGTGVILHTNLGRARLSKSAQHALQQVASNYSSLEYDLLTGSRGSRHDIVEQLICRLTGAEAALVCNNNAAAVFLALKELAQGQEVIVSRGELVEIGGSFRVSEIMRESGAILKEVGTTNKTHLYDYEQAINPYTAMIMKVHTSNFIIQGFTASVKGSELTKLANQNQLPVFEDLGSGVLLDLRPFGIGNEPTVQEVLQEGIDLVSFSTDKLMGGPQAGILAGKKEIIAKLKKNQLMRSLRVDKFTLAALQATLRAYLNPKKAMQEIPTLQMLLARAEEIKNRAEQFISLVDQEKYTCQLIEVQSEVGGGTLPHIFLPSWGVQISSHIDPSTAAFSQRLRQAPFPFIGRIHQDKMIFDFRTIDQQDLKRCIQTLHA